MKHRRRKKSVAKRALLAEHLEPRFLLAGVYAGLTPQMVLAAQGTDAATLRANVSPGPNLVYYDYLDDSGNLAGGVVPQEQVDDYFAQKEVPLPPATLDDDPLPPPSTSTTILNNGPSSNRIDLVILGDGYTSGELGLYATQVNNFLGPFFNISPLNEYKSFFNVHRVDVVSNQSGVDNDPNQGDLKDTALDAGFWCSGTERLLCVSVSKANAQAASAPDRDQVMVLANSTKYGGAGYPSSNLGTVSGGNSSAIEVAKHEFGHSFGDLADEYDYGGNSTYTGGEPSEANASKLNATQMATAQSKWYRWLDLANVDAFEGAKYSQFGIYRPTSNSLMRNLGRPLEEVNVEQMVVSAYKTVKPIDAATPAGVYAGNDTFFVTPVQPVSHSLDVQWFIDNNPIPGATDPTLDLSTVSLAPGSYGLSVVVTDNTSMVRDPNLRAQWLSETRNWGIEVAAPSEPLLLSFDQSSISENGGSTQATISRNAAGDLSSAVAVQLSSNPNGVVTFPGTVTIPVGESSVTFTIAGIDNNTLDGDRIMPFTATAFGYLSAQADLEVTDYETLALTIDVASLAESNQSANVTVTRSNTNWTQPLVVSLSSSDPARLAIGSGSTVTIPAFLASKTFSITTIDNSLLDGDINVTISATATGYVGPETKDVLVTDFESLFLSIVESSINEEGGTSQALITRENTDISQPLTVTITSLSPGKATAPATVQIAAGEASASFTISAVDNDTLDGTQTAGFTAAAAGYQPGSATIDVTDQEFLQLEFEAGNIGENGGITQGTITRLNTNWDLPLTVLLASEDESELTVPASVTIPAGQVSATFAVTAVDDSLLDGDQTVTITASASGYANATGQVLVTDFEQLVIELDTTSISENGGLAILTVTRNLSDTALPLTVTLASSDPSAATIPMEVTILAGEVSAAVQVTAVDDMLLDGTQTALLTASAAGFVDGTTELSVTDYETLSLALDQTSINESGGSVQATIRRNNVDLTEALVVSLDINLPGELEVPATVTIPANEAEVVITLFALDDYQVDGAQLVTLTVSAAGYVGAATDLEVTDAGTLPISSSVQALDDTSYSNSFVVSWSGTAIGNAVITGYDIYFQVESDTPVLWLADTQVTSAIFSRNTFDAASARRKTIHFFSVAKDQFGDLEAQPDVPDASTYYVGAPWQNPADRFDVTPNDGVAIGIPDILQIIAEYKRRLLSDANGQVILPPDAGFEDGPYPDIDGDNSIGISDILAAINYYKHHQGSSGEAAPATSASPAVLAIDPPQPPVVIVPAASAEPEESTPPTEVAHDAALLALLWTIAEDED